MLTTDDFGLNEYVFKSSPESCSDRSYSSDFMDVTSDEDFITQLSTDLDIPLFLNPGEDELGLLNSFFDKSPEEIMAEIASPPPNNDENVAKDACELQDVLSPSPESFPEISDLQDINILKCSPESFPNMQPEVKPEALSPGSMKSPNSPRSPVCYDVKEEPMPASPKSIILNHNEFSNNVIYAQPIQFVAKPKVPLKQIPIVPKKPILNGVKKGSNIVLIKPEVKPVITQPSSIVILDKKEIPTITNTSTSSMVVRNTSVPSVVVRKGVDCMETFSITGNIDPKAFKRQQRKIKNRESASLSRKRKKDYVASLEDQVKELNAENKRLQQENSILKERLAQYEESIPRKPSNKAIKPGLFLCALLLVMGLNIDVLRSPFAMKQPIVMKNDMPKLTDHHSRNLLWTTDDQVENKTSNFSPFFMCPAAINQTESARLVLELERWIGKPANVSGKINLDKNETFTGKLKSRQRRRKYKSDGVVPSYKRYRYKSGPQLPMEPKNEIQVFALQPETTYSEFFEAINRQDDTFYVVSFTDQHMLLPALHHNKTRRPRMSLIMPSMLLNDTISQTSLIPLMQIDCEVLDTRMIHIKHGSIPQHLRAYGNTTKKQPSDNDTGSSNTESKYYKKPYKPFFINKSMLKPDREFLNLN